MTIETLIFHIHIVTAIVSLVLLVEIAVLVCIVRAIIRYRKHGG